MKKLFDASAILTLAKNHPEKAVETLKDQHILDLTTYELGNAIWKINKLHKKPDKETALQTLKQTQNLTALMNKHTINDRQTQITIMENAFNHNLTYYDSAYLTTAQKQNITLITEDQQLLKAAKQAAHPAKQLQELINP